MTVSVWPSDDGKECAIMRAIRHALDELKAEGETNPKVKAIFISSRLRSFNKPEYSLAAALIDRLFEQPKCSECGREK